MNNDLFSRYHARHEAFLKKMLTHTDIPASRIKEAIEYALFPGGKRLRPMLVYLSGQLLSTPIEALDVIAAAVELTHCYSLVHDDLPAMDNDDFRRGKPSCHKAFDEATAILAGDAMQALAIELLLQRLPALLGSDKVVKVVHALVKSSGPSGMVSGQSLDLSELTNQTITSSQLKHIHQLKTGELISTCINMVLASSNATADQEQSLRQFTAYFGLAFQMQDDYLDCYSSEHSGKYRASDTANQKLTFASLLTQEALQQDIQDLYQKATSALAPFSHQADHLNDLLCMLQKPLDSEPQPL